MRDAKLIFPPQMYAVHVPVISLMLLEDVIEGD